ncbi:TadE/TadG family type IV pilus assembly protein [Marimonas lutisalis]|uniref:TadE/TadG family type IV pilus assembly protein n=1 Tax=Marimonas lutisalis TaxID=2545756 RepID=UPI0010F8BF85|nr:TadE/TadG family type IV pilus assembly protein [Marimonas lutisalis]
MVKGKPRKSSFAHDISGLAMTEALIVVPVLILIFGAMVEFSIMVFQWSQTVKALEVGARRVVVSTPLTDITPLSDYDTIPTGDPLPISSYTSVSCGADASACDTTQFNRLYYGADGTCGGLDTSGVVGICDVAPFIRQSNVRITYHRANLGYAGRPNGPVLTVTVEVRNLYFDFFVLDTIFTAFQSAGLPSSIQIPAHPVSMTSEDLCNGRSCS